MKTKSHGLDSGHDDPLIIILNINFDLSPSCRLHYVFALLPSHLLLLPPSHVSLSPLSNDTQLPRRGVPYHERLGLLHLLRAYEALPERDRAVDVVLALLLYYLLELVAQQLRAGQAHGGPAAEVCE